MVRVTHLALMTAVVSLALAGQATAQQPMYALGQPAPDVAGSSEPDPLPGLPRPPDQPASLLRPAPAGPLYGCPQLECPYFRADPRLDPGDLPQPGWLFDVELGIMGSHVSSTSDKPTRPV